MRESLFALGVFTNPKLVLASGISFLLQLAIIYTPFLQPVFKTEPLSLLDLGAILFFSMLPFWAMEAIKAVNRKWAFYNVV
jgi:Ca2+-transporting ATPase